MSGTVGYIECQFVGESRIRRYWKNEAPTEIERQAMDRALKTKAKFELMGPFMDDDGKDFFLTGLKKRRTL